MGLYFSKEENDKSEENKLLKRMLRDNIINQREQKETQPTQQTLSTEDIKNIMINVAENITSKIATTIDERLKNSQQVVYNTTTSPTNSINKYDDFDTSGTMQKLANAMLEPSKNTKSSLHNIGDVHETKKNTKDMDDAVDFLSNVGD